MDAKYTQPLEETLLDGEQVLWEEGTQPFALLEGREGRKALWQWIISTVAFVGLIVLFISQGEVKAGLLIVLLVLYALLMLSPVLSRKKLLGQRYYLTDRRAILIMKDASAYAMDLTGGQEARLFPAPSGPTRAAAVPASRVKEIPFKISRSLSRLHSRETSSTTSLIPQTSFSESAAREGPIPRRGSPDRRR